MTQSTLSGAAILSLTGVVIVPVFPASALAATIEIADDDRTSSITVSDVGRRGDVIVGTLINQTGEQVRDIRLLIDVAFLWKDELKPGDDSPGRSSVLTVTGPIAPHGRLAFEFTPNPPLPERSDGRYADPKVHVMGYQSIATR